MVLENGFATPQWKFRPAQTRFTRESMSTATLTDLIMTRRVIVAVGSGGVGKTTTAAAVAVAAARHGRRVLCLTIDPARRLASSLGIGEMSTEAQHIDSTLVGVTGNGSLTAMMLDTRRTFDELVTRYAQTDGLRDRILSNRIYREVAGSLAGTAEYMAMEKLYALKDDPSYDLIVLDTPPTSNALDFLDAPERMISAIDSTAIRALVQAFEGAGRLSLNLISQAMAKVLTGFAKFTGAGFLEQVAEFLTDMQSLFGGFRERATRVREALKSPSVAFLIVTSPDPMAVAEAMFFSERLTEGGMYTEGLVVNRIRVQEAVEVQSPQRIANVLREAGIEPALEIAGAALRAHQELLVWAHRDASEVARIRRELRNVPRVVEVPAFDEDVHDVTALVRVAALLAPDQES